MAGVRRTWDKELYAAKAKKRLESGDDSKNVEEERAALRLKAAAAIREEFRAADKDAEGPMGSQRAFLNPRQSKIDFEDKVGKVEIIKPGQSNTSHGPGYWCEVCQCLQKDSISYLDHINGKKHQRALGFSMRVERVDVDRVKERLDSLKRKANEDNKKISQPKVPAIVDFDAKMAERSFDEEMQKKKRREDKEMKKNQNIKEDEEIETVDPDISAMMGFGGFSTSKAK